MKVRVTGAGFASVNGLYMPRSLTVVPTAFAATCQRMGWPAEATWHKLAHKPSPAGQQCCWFASQQNDSYIYQHVDGQWWIDGPDGAGIYIANVAANDTNAVPPIQGWKPLVAGVEPLPAVEILE